jgi:RNA polymerase sigma-70 factor (ECF subfamily)
MSSKLTRQDSRFQTRPSLLKRAKGLEDQDACAEIYRIYSPLVFSVAVKAGLRRSEAEDLRQDTMVSLFRKLPHFDYNPAKGQFRTWLVNLTKWRIKDQLRKRRPGFEGVAHSEATQTNRTSTAARIPDPRGCDLEAIWDEELEEKRNALALSNLKDTVSPKQLQIFDLYVLKHWPVAKVSKSLAISRQQVYNARTRILPLYQKQIRRLRGKLL